MKTLEDIIQSVGQFGPYQRRLLGFVCYIAVVLQAVYLVQTMFILGVPEHRCKLPGYENDTFESQGPYHDDMIAAFIPNDANGVHPYDRCHIYVDNVTVTTSNNETRDTRSCTEWVYDTSVFESTVTKELNLVCDKAIMIPNAQSITSVGVLVGSLVFGQVSDIIGRRKAQYLCICLMILSLGALFPMTSYIGIVVLLFFNEAFSMGLFMISYVLGMEFVGPQKRHVVGTVYNIFTSAGGLVSLLMVYLFRSWKYFTAAVTVPLCLLLPSYWFTPESCHWLLTKKRKDEAIETMRKVAKVNKTTLNEKDFDDIEPPKKEERIWLLFSSRRLAVRTLIICFNWFTCSMSYYGFIWNIGNLGGSYYLNFALTMAVEFPAECLCFFSLIKLGSRKLHMVFMLAGSAFCIATLWPITQDSDDLHVPLIAFALMGQLCVTGAFVTVYQLSSELYPTVVRNGGIGISSAVARLGSIVAPYIAKSADLIGGKIGSALPFIIFGIAMLLAGISTWILPEVHNQPLPDTIEDAQNMGRNTGKADGQRTGLRMEEQLNAI